MRRCRGCNTPIDHLRADAVWHSDACRVADYRARKAVQNPNMSLAGMPTLYPTARRVLAALTAAGDKGLTTAQLCQPGVGGVRFGARIMELREVGFTVVTTPERPGSYRYRLHAATEAAA